MKEIARIVVTIEELPEGGYVAYVNPDKPGQPIYGNTPNQMGQRIGKRLEKLIVEEES